MDDLDRIVKMAAINENSDYSYEADAITQARNEAHRAHENLEQLAQRLVKANNTASAASVLSCAANLQQNMKMFKSAIADLGKQYERPGGWDRFKLDGE